MCRSQTYDFSFKNSPRVNSESRRDLPFLLVVVVDVIAAAVVAGFVVVVVDFAFVAAAAVVLLLDLTIGVAAASQPAKAAIKLTHVCEQAAGRERHFSMTDNAVAAVETVATVVGGVGQVQWLVLTSGGSSRVWQVHLRVV